MSYIFTFLAAASESEEEKWEGSTYGWELVCKVPYTSNFNYYGDMESAFTFNPDMMRTVTYDTDATLKKKVCTLKAAQQKTNFGIAAFDIDCDVATMPCAELYLKDGAFTRLKTLGGLRNYISKGLLNKHECLAASV